MLLFINTFVMDIMDFKLFTVVKYLVFINSDFVWFDLAKV